MVALLGLFEYYQIFVEHRLLRESDTVDTGQLLTFFVAPPICSGDGCKLYGLDYVGVHKMRSAAKIGEGSVLVISNGTVFQLADKFTFVRIALGLEVLHGIGL